jgi:hypothetical protein
LYFCGGGGTGVRGENTFGFVAPRCDGAFGFCRGTEDETKEHVETSKSEEEECRHKGEIIHVVRENLSRNSITEMKRSDSLMKCYEAVHEGYDTYRHWKIPRAPRPNSEPRTGK